MTCRYVSAVALASVLALSAVPAWAAEADTTSAESTASAPTEAEVITVTECDPRLTNCPDLEDDGISGGVILVKDYGFSDLFVQTEGLTAQGYLSIPIAGGCSAELFASHGLNTRVGREFDIGGACAFSIADNIEARVSASRYILGGATDITALEGQVTIGQVDFGITQYVVDGSEPDATKLELGYTIQPVERLTIRAVGVYEHGFGLPDIVVGGAEVRYALGGGFSLFANGYAPIRRSAGDPRQAQVFAGIEFNF